VNVIDGKLEFLKMVKSVEDGTYKELNKRFMKLIGIKDQKNIEKIDIESVVNAILNKGLDEGIALYDRFKNS
jgi:RNA-directed DNA polymerase